MLSDATVLRPRRSNWRAQISAGGTLLDHLDGLATHLAANHRSPATVYRYCLAATQLHEFLDGPDVARITTGDIEKFIAHLLETKAPTTAAGVAVALQQVFKYVTRELRDMPGYDNPMAAVKIPTVEDVPVGAMDMGFVAKILAQAEDDPSFEGLRDAAILRILLDTGVRLAEITNLTLADWQVDELRVFRKARGAGKVEGRVVLGRKAQRALQAYLRARRSHPYSESPMLWLGLKGPMTVSGVRQMVWRRSQRAGMRVSPHKFRHTWAHMLKSDDTVRDETIRELAGWSPTSRMIDRYARAVAGDRAREAMRRRGGIGDRL